MLRDTLAKRDSLRAAKPPRQPRDSIKAPIARAEAPRPVEIGGAYVWDRAALFASGAITLQDLLDRIPGITGLRAGWLAAPMASSYLGDVRRVRVFVDGIEYDELDPRTGGVLDLTQVQLWTFEELRIERGATEVRVYARTWRVDRTTPYTRTDISTGDQQTNLYRGYFGRRYQHGENLQLAAQQYGTTPPLRSSASSDQLSLLGRLGWAGRGWSLDAFALRANRHRGMLQGQSTTGAVEPDSIPSLESTRTDAYVRAAVGDPEQGPWLQLMAGALKYDLGPKKNENAFGTATPDTGASRDTSLFRSQYVLTGGFNRWGVQLSAAERLRVQNGRRLWTPSARASFSSGILSVNAFAEGLGPDSLSRAEVTGQIAPLPFVSFLGSLGLGSEKRIGGGRMNTRIARMEAGVRLAHLWVTGGIIRRDSTALGAPRVFNDSLQPSREGAVTGIISTVRGTIYQALKADVSAIRWSDSLGFYRPQYETRSELYVRSSWLSRFPSGNFGVLASLQHEYRSSVHFPVIAAGELTSIRVSDARSLSFLLEIRVVSAVLSYQFRNLLGQPYQTIPGFLMPRQTQFYGVRWEFWN